MIWLGSWNADGVTRDDVSGCQVVSLASERLIGAACLRHDSSNSDPSRPTAPRLWLAADKGRESVAWDEPDCGLGNASREGLCDVTSLRDDVQ